MNRLLELLVCFVSYWISALVPRSPRKVAFGAWGGKIYSDNPKYLFEYAVEHSNLDIRWIGGQEQYEQMGERQRKLFLRAGSLKAIWFIMRAKWWVCCQGPADLSSKAFYHGAECLNLWHGIPLKLMGMLTPRSKVLNVNSQNFMQKFMNGFVRAAIPSAREWTIASSDRMGEIMSGSFPGRFPAGRVLYCGTPRNDFILNNRENGALCNALRAKYARLFGFDVTKRIVLYVPTWRMNENAQSFTFYGLEEDRKRVWHETLEAANAVLIEKHHLNTFRRLPVPAECAFPYVVTRELQFCLDIQELILITDVLITDYSSVYVDFALTGRNCLHFVYDYEQYVSGDSGLAYDMKSVSGGPFLKMESELLGGVKQALAGEAFERGPRFDDLIAYENGTACKELFDFIGRRGAND